MNIKKQIILDDKDYERLVHDANLSNNELSAKDWILFTSIILSIFAMGFAGGWLVFN